MLKKSLSWTNHLHTKLRFPSYIYNRVYNDRDPIDAVAFTTYIHNKEEKIEAVCNKKERKKNIPQDKLQL